MAERHRYGRITKPDILADLSDTLNRMAAKRKVGIAKLTEHIVENEKRGETDWPKDRIEEYDRVYSDGWEAGYSRAVSDLLGPEAVLEARRRATLEISIQTPPEEPEF